VITAWTRMIRIKLFHRDFLSLDPQSLMSKDLIVSKMAFLPSKRKKRSRRNILRLLPFTSSIRPVSNVPTAKLKTQHRADRKPVSAIFAVHSRKTAFKGKRVQIILQ
jgi:hypothetical protein